MRQALIREKIREVLAMAPTRRFTEQMLCDALGKLLADPPTLIDLRNELSWNHESDYIDYRHNRDTNLDEWFLTERGKEKERGQRV